MAFSPYIGRIFGISIQLHWSFLLLLFFSLYISVASGSLYFFLIIILLFICVFIHELAHSITAKRNNLKIKKIILLPIGGASIIDEESKMNPELEFRVALAGPLMSILLGLLFGLLTIYTPSGMVKELFQFLFLINIILGIFNIMPAFPLDGGRVLRGYLRKTRDQIAATQLAAKISNVFIVLFVVFTFAYVALLKNYSFLYKEFIVIWDLFIALYLYNGSKAELQDAYIHGYASNLKVKHVVSKNYIEVKPNATMLDIYNLMLKRRSHIIIVRGKVNGHNIVRMVTKLSFNIIKDKRYKTAYEASSPLPFIDINANISSALDNMAANNARVLAAFNKGRFAGIVIAEHVESIIILHVSKQINAGKKVS